MSELTVKRIHKLNINYKYLLLLSVFIFFFILSFFQIRNYLDDDYIFRLFQEEYQSDLYFFISDRYSTWSSRFIIDSFTIFMYEVPILWSFVMPLVFVLLSYSIYRLIGKDSWLVMIIAISISFIYPALYSYEVGWITTSLNYIVPIALAVYISSILIRIYRKQKIYWFSYVFASLALLYASNEEFVSIAILLVTAVFLFFLIKQKNYSNIFPYIIIVVCMAMSIFSLTCPGNYYRYTQEESSFFPGFSDVNFFQKIYIGLFRSSSSSIFESNICFYFLGFTIIVFTFSKSKLVFHRLISFIPLFSAVLFSIIFRIGGDYSIYNYFHKFLMSNLRNASLYSSWESYFEIGIFSISATIITYLLIALNKMSLLKISLPLVLLLGIGTQFGVALSPQIGYLWYRTDAFFAMSMLVCAAFLLSVVFESKKKWLIYVSLAALIIFVICVSVFNIMSYPF